MICKSCGYAYYIVQTLETAWTELAQLIRLFVVEFVNWVQVHTTCCTRLYYSRVRFSIMVKGMAISSDIDGVN